jgi:DNA invertase Pin-like site-specific DNA recombinase
MLSTDSKLFRDIVLAVMASLAQQERPHHIERVHAGIARARSQGTASGKPIGCPPLDERKAMNQSAASITAPGAKLT